MYARIAHSSVAPVLFFQRKMALAFLRSFALIFLNEASEISTVESFIKHFNKKFFHNDKENELTWCMWYFPAINTTKRLGEIDEYMISCIRYIATGKHTKANYNLRYEKIKALGYISLVNAYYRFKRGKEFPIGEVDLEAILASENDDEQFRHKSSRQE